MQPGNIIISGKGVFRVTGIFLGAVNSQDMVGLVPIVMKDGSAYGKIVKEMFVPMELAMLGTIYKEV